MVKCNFCNQESEPYNGVFYITDDSKTFYFCSSKCRKNFKMGRKSRKLKWARKK